MNNFKLSNPDEHFRDRRRVLITSPDGRTMVFPRKISTDQSMFLPTFYLTAFRNHSPLAVPYFTALAEQAIISLPFD